jgi:hypothetical protein
MTAYHMPDSYYTAPDTQTFVCSHCDRELDEADREPELTVCRGRYRFKLLLFALHRARETRRECHDGANIARAS